MKTLNLPNSDVVISKAVFGTSRLGGTIERFDKREALDILRRVLDAGVHTFDTADIYAQGNSERLLAEAFQGRRDQVVYATKGGYVLSGKARLLAKVKPLVRHFMKLKPGLTKAAGRARGGQMARNFSRDHLTRAVEASLRRLRTDVIDIYQLHSPTVDYLRNSDAFETLADLKQAGKIRAYGVSLLSWSDLSLCFGRGVSCVQVEAGPGCRWVLPDRSVRLGDDEIFLVGRQILGGRVLFEPPVAGPAATLRELGDPVELLLRYHLHHSPFDAFLFATTRLAHANRNLEFFRRPPLDADILAALESNLNSQPIGPR